MGKNVKFIKPSHNVIVSAGYKEFPSIIRTPERAMNVALHLCQVLDPRGRGMKIKARKIRMGKLL